MTFNREPAMILAFISAIITAASAFVFELSIGQQGALNAVAAGVLGVLVALAIKGEKLLAAIVGLAQAIVALVVSFGADFTPEQQAAIMPLVSLAAAMWLRTQVVAKEPPTYSRAIAVDHATNADVSAKPAVHGEVAQVAAEGDDTRAHYGVRGSGPLS